MVQNPVDADLSGNIYDVLQRVNDAAISSGGSAELSQRTLTLLVDASGAEAGMLFAPDCQAEGMVCEGGAGEQALLDKILSPDGGELLTEVMQVGAQVIEVEGSNTPPALERINRDGGRVKNLFYLPVSYNEHIRTVYLVFNFPLVNTRLLQHIGERLAYEIVLSLRIEAGQQRSRRLESLNDLIAQISSTLARDQILGIIIDYAHQMLDAEAGSLFMVDEKTGDLLMHISSNLADSTRAAIRVPAGQGIIGHVVETGETVIVNDVASDRRHYSGVDKNSGVVTDSLLAVPLKTRQVVLGNDRGATQERIIGGLEAINKIGGRFTNEDAELLQTLANQAATVLEIADLYADANELFLDAIKALTAAIDAKDSYTEGHSQRVSEFSVEIANELKLPPEVIYHIQIGSLLHDMGKIGIPDSILSKPGLLTDKEFMHMKDHPGIGARIMSQVRSLRREIPALAEHHERPDGSGYPNGLVSDQISLTGLIVSVADVFDALTSDRPYRGMLPVDEVFTYLQSEIGTKFDRECVEALQRAYAKGRILTQKDRE